MERTLIAHKLLAAAVVIACTLALPCAALADEPGDAEQPTVAYTDATTTLSGVKTSYSVDYTKTGSLTDTIKVSPAYGRSVRLYAKSAESGAWELVKTMKTANTKTARVTVKYPKRWKQYYKSSWKIVVPAAELDSGITSEDGVQQLCRATKSVAKVSVSNDFTGCKAAIVVDAKTGELLYGKRVLAKRKIASMTKLMTALLLVENVPLSKKVKIASAAASTPWGIGVVAGDSITARNLLYAMMLPSANDCATAAGIEVSGSIKKFTKKMDARAKELGCRATHYTNAHGLDTKGNHSCAYDVSRVACHIATSKSCAPIRKAAATRTRTIKSAGGQSYALATTNKLLGKVTGLVGLKTGTTDDAGGCFSGLYKYKGHTYVTVVMGAGEYDSSRWTDTKALLKFARYAAKAGLAGYEV